MKPYGVMADLHAFNWSAFATLGQDGMNMRLACIVEEINRCCRKVIELGGDTVVIAGDVFHTRGSVAPSVFNPVKAAIERWAAEGITFQIIPGNHDLETKNSLELTSAVAMLAAPGVEVIHKPAFMPFSAGELNMAYLPWHNSTKETLAALGRLRKQMIDLGVDVSQYDLFIHAGIDGVLKGVPDHGLTPKALADFGFRRVFAGHYHHHADMGDGVYSIGSPTHQTWSDVGTKAGWLIVDKDVRWFASHAPNFIEITGAEDPEDLPMIVDGHYVRARIGAATAAQVAAWRQDLLDAGAKGAVIQATPVVTAPIRGTVAGSTIERIDDAITDYCIGEGLSAVVAGRCIAILQEAQS